MTKFASTRALTGSTTHTRWASFLAILLAVLFSCSPMSAQEITGDLAGTVYDDGGAIVPQAQVVLINEGTQARRSDISGAQGEFVLAHLPIGTYRLEISSPGFKQFSVSGIVVTAGGRLHMDAKLSVGSNSEVVEVNASQLSLQTDSASISSNISESALKDLPTNGRNFVSLVTVQPGVNSGVQGSISSGTRANDRRQTSTISANGQGDTTNNFMLDGTDNNERFQGLIGIRPSLEALKEVNVSTNTYDPELGRTSGAVIQMLTKSGTNHFHGTAYEFFRNDITDSKDFFATTIRKPKLRQNQFGGSIGGPIWRNKTFFFADYEGFRQSDATSTVYTSTVPTLYQQQHPGNFSDVGGSVIPTAYLNSTALNYFKLFPAPNQVGTVDPTTHVTSLNYLSNPSRTQNQDTFDIRGDHNFNPNNLFFTRYSYSKTFTTMPSPFPQVNGVYAGGAYGGNYAGSTDQRAHNAQLDYTHIFSPNVLLELRAGYSKFISNAEAQNAGTNYNQGDTYSIPGVNVGYGTSGLAPIYISGYATLGDALYLPFYLNENTFQYNGALTWTRGKHTMKFGGALIRRQVADFNSPMPKGIFIFLLGGSPVANMQSFLTGRYFVYQRQQLLQQTNFRFWEPSTFAQDTWRVTDRLTITAGLRYDVFTPPQEKNNVIANLDMSTLKLVIGNTGGVKTQYGNVAPRIGFSATVAPKTVVRGGFGLSFFPTDLSNNDLLYNPPYSYATGTVVNLTTPISAGVASPPTSVSTTNLSGALSAKPMNYHNGLMEQFNLFIQHQVGANIFTVGYVGELGRHLMRGFSNINIPAPNGTSTPSPAPYATQLPNVNTIAYYGDSGTSSYHALQANYDRQFKGGLHLSANYTLAHGLDNASAVGPGNGEGTGLILDNSHYDYGNSTLDVRHRIAVLGSYALPFAKEATGVRQFLFGGWQINGVGFWQTGTPFTVQSSVQHIDVSSTITVDRPNMLYNPNRIRSLSSFFDTKAFQAQAAGTAGNEARNQLYGPHLRRVDLSLFKTFDIHNDFKLQFRTEAFNISNTPNFSNPNNTISSFDSNGIATTTGGFGAISKTNSNVQSRQFQFAAKILF